jgi:hypothetical protein
MCSGAARSREESLVGSDISNRPKMPHSIMTWSYAKEPDIDPTLTLE